MKTVGVTPALTSLLSSGRQFIVADCYTFTLASGAVLRYTSFDRNVTYNSNTFLATGPVLERGPVRLERGLTIGTLVVSVHPKDTDLADGLPFLQAVAAGVFDAATLLLEKVFLDSALAVVGRYINFSGRIGDISCNRGTAEFDVNDYRELLSIQLPRNMYAPACVHTLYDIGCTKTRTGNNSSVAAGSTAQVILCGLAQAAQWFDVGYIQLTSGPMSGSKRTVRAYVPGQLTLVNALPAVPSTGTTFTAYPGCDKTKNTCESKFANSANFKGFPYVPDPETAV